MAAPSSSGSRPTRRAFLAALAAGGAGLSAAAYARYAEPTWFELAEVPLDRALFPAPAGLRILHLSDLHEWRNDLSTVSTMNSAKLHYE